MPPVPPARRQTASAVAAPPKPLSAKHVRFLRLLFADPEHPSKGLDQAGFEALPPACRTALADVATRAHLDQYVRMALEAYYGSGHKPAQWPGPGGQGMLSFVDEDVRRATAMMEAPLSDIPMVMGHVIGLTDNAMIMRAKKLVDAPELKSGDKIRLEALRLLMQLKGMLREENQQVTQATQIVLHLAPAPGERPPEAPTVIGIEL